MNRFSLLVFPVVQLFAMPLCGVEPTVGEPPSVYQGVPSQQVLGQKGKGYARTKLTPEAVSQSAADNHLVRVSGQSSLTPLFIPPGSRTDSFLKSRVKPFTDLQNVVEYIQRQRQGVQYSDGSEGVGLPKSYFVPPGVTADNQTIQESAVLYDTSLALLALVQNGNLESAKDILDIFVRGSNGTMEMRAFPFQKGDAYEPFDQNVSYFFDHAKVSGVWSPDWQLYDVHTGPNAWLAMAAARYIEAARLQKVPEKDLQPYLGLVTRLGDAMIRLQIQDGPQAGAILYGPQANDNSDQEINTENDMSAYAALNAISRVTQTAKYSQAAVKVSNWLFTQPGLRDPASGLFRMGLNLKGGTWQVQSSVATDSGGTWAISALGPELIDAKLGSGAAYQMWAALRSQMGRTAQVESNGSLTMRASGQVGRLDGLDFSALYSASEGLISPEWSAGGVNALQQLITYYESKQGFGVPASDEILAMKTDVTTMKAFIAQHSTAYAVGPGLSGSRQGQTGFNWQAPSSDQVSAMAAIYGVLDDPLSWARGR